jgi:hypothetical protein
MFNKNSGTKKPPFYPGKFKDKEAALKYGAVIGKYNLRQPEMPIDRQKNKGIW